MVDDAMERLSRPAVSLSVVGVLLFGGLLVDLTTRQDLVVAIIYNIPIAISGLAAKSQSLTRWTIGGALGANVAAAYENALNAGGYDGVTITNRGFAALTFLLVGALTLGRESAAEEISELEHADADSRRERELRHLLRDLAEARDPDDLVRQAVPGLRELLRADELVIATLDDDGRFCEPRFGDGHSEDLAPVGTHASWAVDAIPRNDRPAVTVRSERGLLATGRWRRPDGDTRGDLVVIADQPKSDKSAYLLGEALHALEPMLRRSFGAGQRSEA